MSNSLNLDMTANFGFTDASVASTAGGRVATLLAEDNSYGNMSDLDTRLQIMSGSTYTQAYLRTLNKNDKVYALRLASADVAGVH